MQADAVNIAAVQWADFIKKLLSTHKTKNEHGENFLRAHFYEKEKYEIYQSLMPSQAVTFQVSLPSGFTSKVMVT